MSIQRFSGAENLPRRSHPGYPFSRTQSLSASEFGLGWKGIVCCNTDEKIQESPRVMIKPSATTRTSNFRISQALNSPFSSVTRGKADFRTSLYPPTLSRPLPRDFSDLQVGSSQRQLRPSPGVLMDLVSRKSCYLKKGKSSKRLHIGLMSSRDSAEQTKYSSNPDTGTEMNLLDASKISAFGLKSTLRKALHCRPNGCENSQGASKGRSTVSLATTRDMGASSQTIFSEQQSHKYLLVRRKNLPGLLVMGNVPIPESQRHETGQSLQENQQSESADPLKQAFKAALGSDSVLKYTLADVGFQSGAFYPVPSYDGKFLANRKVSADVLYDKMAAQQFDAEDVRANPVHVERLLIETKHTALETMPAKKKAQLLSQLMHHWIDIVAEDDIADLQTPLGGDIDENGVLFDAKQVSTTNRIEKKLKISQAAANLFQVVEETFANPETETDTSTEYLEFFFKACDRLVRQEQTIESNMEAGLISEDNLASEVFNLCAGMHQLISVVKPKHFLIGEFCLMQLLQGYLQNLFLLLYEFTELPLDAWMTRLERMNYCQLGIPQNVDFFFSNIRLTNMMDSENTEFYKYFNRFYICVLGILMKSEFVRATDQVLWGFLVDMYSIHFCLSKSVKVSKLCRLTLESIPSLTAENVLLRYAALVKSLPRGYLIAAEVQQALKFNYAQVSKVYQNAVLYSEAAITQIHSAIVKEVFLTLFDLIDKRYGNDNEQRAILELCSSWMKILSFYINYSIHFGGRQKNVAKTFGKFKKDFQQMLHMIWSRKIIRENKYVADSLYQLTLSATDGIQLALDFTEKVSGQSSKKKMVTTKKAAKKNLLAPPTNDDDGKSCFSLYSEQNQNESFEVVDGLEAFPEIQLGEQPRTNLEVEVPTEPQVLTIAIPKQPSVKIKLTVPQRDSDKKNKPSKFTTAKART